MLMVIKWFWINMVLFVVAVVLFFLKKKTSLAFKDSSLKLFSSQILISSLILRVSFGTTCVRHVTFKRAKCESPGWGAKKICVSFFFIEAYETTLRSCH